MRRFLTIAFAVIFAVCLAAPADAATNYIRAFTTLTGGGTGALDKVASTSLVNNDLAVVITSAGAYFYHYDSSSYASESSPDVIGPDDAPATGRWLLMNLYTGSVVSSAATDPYIKFDSLAGQDVYIGKDDSNEYLEVRLSATKGLNVIGYIDIDTVTPANSLFDFNGVFGDIGISDGAAGRYEIGINSNDLEFRWGTTPGSYRYLYFDYTNSLPRFPTAVVFDGTTSTISTLGNISGILVYRNGGTAMSYPNGCFYYRGISSNRAVVSTDTAAPTVNGSVRVMDDGVNLDFYNSHGAFDWDIEAKGDVDFNIEVENSGYSYVINASALSTNRSGTLEPATGSGAKHRFTLSSGNATYYFRLEPDGTDTLVYNNGGTWQATTSAGDYLQSRTIYSRIEVEDIATGIWYVNTQTNTWAEQ